MRTSFPTVTVLTAAIRRSWLPLFALGLTAGSAVAADATQLDPVVVTGSRTQERTVLESPVPIDVLSSDEIRASGQTEVAKIIQSLVPSFNFPHPTTPDGNTHIRSATLRGLSPDQVLVLVNGKRYHTSAWVNTGGTIGKGSVSTDLNSIPTSSIERIEILRDGASAQYGSDAIAGVINIILRKDVGLEGSASYGETKDGGGDTWKASLDAGFPLGDDGVIHATLDYRNRKAADRSEADTRQQYFGISPTGAPVALSGLYGSGTGLNPPGGAATTRLDPREATINRKGLWRFADSADTIEKNLFVNAIKPLGESGVEFYSFGGYRVSDGLSNASLRRSGQPENVRAIHPDGFLPYVATTSIDYSAAIGLRGQVGTWDWDASTSYGGNDLKYYTRNTLNATLGAASPTAFYNGKLESAQWTTNVDLRNSFDIGWHAPLRVATGVEFREDSYRISPGELGSYQYGPFRVLDGPAAGSVPTIGSQGFAGIQPGDSADESRRNIAVYGEVETDLTDKLLASIAGRYEHFSDFGSTSNGKLALRYAVTDGFALRGSVSSGFHAPALAQQYFSSTSSRTLNNANTGLPEYVLVRTAPVDSPEAIALGARALKPEESTNLSAGFTWTWDALALSLDAYRIDIDDRIYLSSNFVDAAGQNVIRNFLAAQGLPGVTSVRYFSNAADTRTKGVDLSARYRFDLADAGRLDVTAGYNRNKTELTRVASTPQALLDLGIRTPLFDITERTRVETGQPKDSFLLGANWGVGRWGFNALTKRYGELRVVAATNQSAANVAQFALGSTGFTTRPTEAGSSGNVDVIQILKPKWVTDLSVSFAFTEKVKTTLGADNVFNTYPTRNIATTASVSGADTFGVFPYNEVSPFGFSGAYYYARVDVRF